MLNQKFKKISLSSGFCKRACSFFFKTSSEALCILFSALKRGTAVLKRSRLPRVPRPEGPGSRSPEGDLGTRSCHRALAPEKARQSRANKNFSLGNFYVFKTAVPSAGFTLIETIVALAVITSAVVGPFTLATKGILHASFAKNKIIAANLSQEGIELTRKIRENNILASRSWDAGISSGSWQIDIFSSDLSPFSGVPMLFDGTTGIYSQANGLPTLFTRKIIITKPSANEIDVISEVSWAERNIDRKVILSEKLYNWR